MASIKAISINLLFYCLLLALFIIFFGIPSIQKYLKKETITVYSQEFTNGIEAPAVTLLALNNEIGYGWKNKSSQTDSFAGKLTNTFVLDHCMEINQTDLEACVTSDSIGLTDFLKNAAFGLTSRGLNTSEWTWDVDNTAWGRYFTWNPQKLITPEWTDFMFMSTHKNFKMYVLIHDIKYFLFNSNPLGPVKSIWDFDGTAVSHHYQEISLVKQKKLNLDHQPCNEDENYNFKSCVKESIARQVGCQRPWDRGNKKTKICTTREQFRKHDMLFNKYMLYDSAQIEWTGCLKPCAYKEYRILNSVPKTISTVPEKEEVAFALWTVSQYTQHEEEVIFIESQTPFHHIFLRCCSILSPLC